MQPHANTRPARTRGQKRRRQGADRNNTKHKNAHRRTECTGIVLDSKRYFLPSLPVHQVLSFARLLTRREREKTKSAERPGREKMYCTFLRTRCIDCHTSVPEKRHCAIERERETLGLVFPPRPRSTSGRERGTSWDPSICRQGLRRLPLAAKELKWGRGSALSYLCSQRASREADDVRTHSCRQRTGCLKKHVCDPRGPRVGGREEICEALLDSIQKEMERHGGSGSPGTRRPLTTAL